MLNRPAFRAWLEAQPPDTVIGYTGGSDCCPVTTYLRQSSTAQIFTRVLDIQVDGELIVMPKWGQQFVVAIDEYGPGLPVAAADVLAVLDAIGEDT